MGWQWLARHIAKVILVLVTLVCYISIKNIALQPRDIITAHIPLDGQYSQPPKDVVAVPKDEVKPAQNDKEPDSPVTVHRRTPEEQKCAKKWLGTPKSITKSAKAEEYSDVTCDKLLFGNGTGPVYDHARKFMELEKKKLHSDTYFQELIQDEGCTEFKLRRGYHLNPVDAEEADYPIAYNILVHRDVEQVEDLLRAIYRPQNSYCIHVDAKVKSDLMESVRAIASCFQNVFLSSRLERIVYAGFSRLQADINCMKDQVKNNIKWKYLINTAGQGFPAKTNLEMVKILTIYNGANDIEGIYGARVHRSRFENEWKEIDVDTKSPKLNKTGKKNPKPPYDIDIVRGSAYGIFSREFVDWMLTDEKAKALLEWSQTTWSPDEHYWATLHHAYSNPHMHAPGSYAGIPNEKPWYAVWVAWGGQSPCLGRWQRGTCLFGVGDLPSLTNRPELMLNKLSAEFQYLTQECLGRWIEYKVDCPPDFNRDIYEKLPFVIKK